jgi:hypothetical protein
MDDTMMTTVTFASLFMFIFFFVNHSFITQIELLQSDCKHCNKKLGERDQAKDCEQDDTCCTQRCAAKFIDLQV